MESNIWLLSKLKENINSKSSEDVFYKGLIKDLCKEILAEENLRKLVEGIKLSNNDILSENESDKNLDVLEACKFLRISRASLYNQKKNPHFPKPRRVGRRVIYSKNSLIEYLNKVKSYVREPP